jgi:hypothetical protein
MRFVSTLRLLRCTVRVRHSGNRTIFQTFHRPRADAPDPREFGERLKHPALFPQRHNRPRPRRSDPGQPFQEIRVGPVHIDGEQVAHDHPVLFPRLPGLRWREHAPLSTVGNETAENDPRHQKQKDIPFLTRHRTPPRQHGTGTLLPYRPVPQPA